MQRIGTGEIVVVTRVTDHSWRWRPAINVGVVMNESTKDYLKIFP